MSCNLGVVAQRDYLPAQVKGPGHINLSLEIEQAIYIQLFQQMYYLSGRVLEFLSGLDDQLFQVSAVVALVDLG